jgi:hypothetical protein
MKITLQYVALVGVLLLAGCAFDVSYVSKKPATFTVMNGISPDLVLQQDVKVDLGTGYPTRLKGGTRWHQVGSTEYGDVFATKDQIVTVEASNIYEAQLIVSNQCITGFYLPVEKMVTPVSNPIHIEMQTVNKP